MGWPAKSVETIDEDQGRTAAASAHRHGFKNLMAEIGAGQVGVLLALEASRLARSSVDWYRLIEICVITHTLLADETTVFPKRVEKASPEEMPLYSEEAEADLIEESLKLAKEKIEDLKLSHHPDLHRQVIEQCMEEHRERVDSIRLLFRQKRTGLPF